MDAVDYLKDLADAGWLVSIDNQSGIYTVLVCDKDRPRRFQYTGTNLTAQIKRAWAGEPGDRS